MIIFNSDKVKCLTDNGHQFLKFENIFNKPKHDRSIIGNRFNPDKEIWIILQYFLYNIFNERKYFTNSGFI